MSAKKTTTTTTETSTARRAKKDTQQPAQLTWQQINDLTHKLAVQLGDDLEAASMIMLLMQEIGTHGFDNSHVETIANLTTTNLFAWTQQHDEAFRNYIADFRGKVVNNETNVPA